MVPYRGRNVQEQNEDTRAQILQTVSSFEAEPLHYRWLTDSLLEYHLQPSEGILINLHHFPDQGGDLWEGIWLTTDQRFFGFSILAPPHDNKPEVERWDEITAELPINAHQAGTGKSFASLALEILNQFVKRLSDEQGPAS